MKWSDVTLWQYQQIENLISKRGDDTDLDIAVKTLAILTDRTETQIDSLSIADLKEQLKMIEFINAEKPEPKPKDYIKVGKKKYRCIYDVRKMPYARYVEAKYFASDVTNNLHKIAASMVMPMKWTWRGWKLAKYDASLHDEYAQDLLSAPFEQVYGSVVFLSSLRGLDNQFKGLFQGADVEIGDESGGGRDDNSGFMRQYGWIYQATLIADFERIRLEEVYQLPTINALNDLSYLKSKGNYDSIEMKKIYGKH